MLLLEEGKLQIAQLVDALAAGDLNSRYPFFPLRCHAFFFTHAIIL
jgi:hypothetical protein